MLMNLHRQLKSLVITYEDGEVLRLTGEQATQYQNKIKEMTHSHSLRLLKETAVDPIDLESDFEYEVIRNVAKF